MNWKGIERKDKVHSISNLWHSQTQISEKLRFKGFLISNPFGLAPGKKSMRLFQVEKKEFSKRIYRAQVSLTQQSRDPPHVSQLLSSLLRDCTAPLDGTMLPATWSEAFRNKSTVCKQYLLQTQQHYLLVLTKQNSNVCMGMFANYHCHSL